MEDLSEMCHIILSRARGAVAKVILFSRDLCIIYLVHNHKRCVDFQVREYQASFSSYRYLWTDDRSDDLF